MRRWFQTHRLTDLRRYSTSWYLQEAAAVCRSRVKEYGDNDSVPTNGPPVSDGRSDCLNPFIIIIIILSGREQFERPSDRVTCSKHPARARSMLAQPVCLGTRDQPKADEDRPKKG